MIESSGMPINPNDVMTLDELPPQSGIQAVIDYDTNRVKFRAYYLAVNQDVYGPWTEDYDLEDTPIPLKWVELWPRGIPIHN